MVEAKEILTEDEKKEFNLINFFAFDTALSQARTKGQKIPLWLCSSKEAKEQYRKVIEDNLLPAVQRVSFMTITDSNKDEILEGFLRENLTQHMKNLYDKWVKAETLAKESRNEGNPQAFFA